MLLNANNKKTIDTAKLITCLNCGKTFEYDKRRSSRKFCNEKCRNEYYGIESKKSKTITKICRFCKKEFECSASTPNKVFCSTDCSKSFYKTKYESKKAKETIQEKRICPYCGKEFIWKLSKSGQKYCSRECSDKANKEKYKSEVWIETRTCEYCGKAFEWISSKSNQKYCSAECRQAVAAIKIKNYSNKTVQKTDEQLRNEVYLKVLEIISKMNQTKGKFHGDSYIDYWRVGKISEKTRETVLERDNHECQICKRKDSLHLHHLIKRKNGGNHEAENLITLCASCHRHIETGDVEHATNTCLKNVKRCYGKEEPQKPLDVDELRTKLTFLFDKLKESSSCTDIELLVCLAEALDLIDTH